MTARDWLRTIHTRKASYTQEDRDKFDAAVMVANKYVMGGCSWNSSAIDDFLDTYTVYEYYTHLDSIYLGFKPQGDMWQLRYLSFDSSEVPADEIAGVIMRGIKELLVSNYRIGMPFRGLFFRHLTRFSSNPIYIKIVESIKQGLIATNYQNFVNTSITTGPNAFTV